LRSNCADGSIRFAGSEAARRIARTYANLKETYLFFLDLNLLDFDDRAYSRFMELRQQGVRIGTQDLRIAAIALAVGGVVVTRNRRDFERVPGLAIEDWSIAR
jgi:tRNA(fMet)-specific endonuclease VapC